MPRLPGWNRTNVFNAAWMNELETVPQYFYAAKIEIYSVDATDPVFDPVTGTYTGGSGETTFWEGSARVQPINKAQNVSNNASDTLVQQFRFQITQRDLDLRPNMYVRVTECENNNVLLAYRYVIDEVADSSNLIERTFTAHVDTEVVKS